MNLLYSYEAFLAPRGGVPRLFIELARYGLNKAGINLRVFAGVHRCQYLCEDRYLGARCVGWHLSGPLAKLRLLLPLNYALFSVYARCVKVDLCHYTYQAIPPVHRRAKVVITVHDLVEEHLHPGGRVCTKARQRRRALQRADGIICVSENTKTDLLRYYPEAHEKQIRVIYNGNNLDSVAAVPVTEDKAYLLYVGNRSARHKNFGVVLKAFEQCVRCHDWNLVCFGGGKLNDAEREQIKQLGMESHVFSVSGDDALLSGYYRNAVALVYPSAYEGFGIPPVEAMSVGCPVLCSSAPPMPEVCGDAALYFPPDDDKALVATMNEVVSQDARHTLIAKGLQKARGYTWEKTAKETYAFYADLLGS